MCLGMNGPGKGFRVALDSNLNHRKGIFAADLMDLKTKTTQRFKLRGKPEKLKVLLEDGTEIDDEDYLESVPAQSRIVVVTDVREKTVPLHHAENLFDHFLSLVRWNGGVDTVYQEVLQFMREDFTNKYSQISKRLKSRDKLGEKTKLSRREEDPDWFQDLSTGAKTKEEFMFRNSQSRIRGYLSRADSQLKETKLTKKEGEMLTFVLDHFRCQLKKNGFHGQFFHRASDSLDRICDEDGLFKCEGRYAESSCSYVSECGDSSEVHEINPYSSREARILFSTWNLDHVIERSRSIVPSIIEAAKLAAKSQKHRQINVDYFYSLMFTRTNLRLVHIVCHDKQEHATAKCDKKMYFK